MFFVLLLFLNWNVFNFIFLNFILYSFIYFFIAAFIYLTFLQVWTSILIRSSLIIVKIMIAESCLRLFAC